MESHRFRELCSCGPCADTRALALELAEAARKLRVCEDIHERAYASVVRINERLHIALANLVDAAVAYDLIASNHPVDSERKIERDFYAAIGAARRVLATERVWNSGTSK